MTQRTFYVAYFFSLSLGKNVPMLCSADGIIKSKSADFIEDCARRWAKVKANGPGEARELFAEGVVSAWYS